MASFSSRVFSTCVVFSWRYSIFHRSVIITSLDAAVAKLQLLQGEALLEQRRRCLGCGETRRGS